MYANLVLTNAKIYTLNPTQPWAEALACAHGRFLAVGSHTEIQPLIGPHTQVIDGHGRLALPGLIDSHVHFLATAERRQQISLFGLRDFAEVRQRVATAVSQATPGQWLLGWGWDEHFWDVAPHADWLDELAPYTPIALARMDMHTWWVNSAALHAAGITAETPDPPESKIERDENGRLTGLLREWQAIELVQRQIPTPDEATRLRWLRQAIGAAHRLGLTGIHDQRVEREGAESFRLWQILNRHDQLPLRVHMNIAADFIPQAATLGLQPGFGDDRLWVGHAKAFADGTMGSRTAWMLAPFAGDPHNTGIAVTPPAELCQLAEQAAAAGFPLSIHAIGDRAVREVLDVLGERAVAEAAHPPLMPHRIEHVQLIHPDDLPRLAQYGIVAAVQPVHLQTDWPTADQVWGNRARYAYAFRSLLDQGTTLAFGSDAPVAPLNPMWGIFAAVARQDERGEPANGWYAVERLTLAEALAAYTLGPAQLSGKTAVQGSIAPGKWADFILLQDDLFQIPVAAIPAARVGVTAVAGDVVYAYDGLIE